MSGLFLLTLLTQMATAALPTPPEMEESQYWIQAKFAGVADTAPLVTGIEVLANNDPVQMNSRGGKPLHIANQEFTRGLYCHANSRIVVHLPKPARQFEAVVGIDTNDNTTGHRGSVVFSVEANEKELWHSDLLQEGMPGVPVSVALGGVNEFILAIGDGGDGIGWDQSDWADARVILEDGSELWLGDMPQLGHQRAIYNTDPFFSFVYDGKPSSEFLSSWKLERTSKKLDDQRTQYTLVYTDPKTGLVVRCEGIGYADYPTIEWTLFYKNTSNTDTPILSHIQAIDSLFERNVVDEFVLHRNKGDECTADSFQPIDDPLPAGTDKLITNRGGRPTQGEWPYFNISAGNGGLIFVVSWAGQWSSQFTRDEANGLRLRAGQELTHFKLLPGEEIRTPMIVLQFWKGDQLHAQNVWRAWMIAHNIPRPGGKLPPLPELAACSSHQFGEMINANTDNQKFFIDKYLERGLILDYWWMDAGWYYNKTGWPHTGTWEVDQNRFPGGLRPICDHADSKGVNSIVWFEPERVAGDTWLTDNHPEWILGGKDGGLLDLGNKEAWTWLVNHIDGLIAKEGIDLYRQDFNMDPLSFWRGNDPEDRQGITEIRHVEGYLAYWDELIKRHPNMLIDSCASGGRRNDLETLRRAVPLLRSDYIMEPLGNQCHGYTLPSWIPFFGTGTSSSDTYMVRSTLCPHFTACWDQRKEDIDWKILKHIMDQWKQFAPNYFGDFYPLTPYSLKDTDWIGWQYNRPDSGTGFVQTFRRPNSIYMMAQLPLKGLDPNGRYTVTNVDEPSKSIDYSGQELMSNGIPVSMPDRPSSAIFFYTKQ